MGIAWIIPFLLLPPDQPAGLILADRGRAATAVYVAADASEPERHAAAELARFLKEIAGADFAVVEGAPPPEEPAILVGPGAAAGFFRPEELAELGGEGYRIRTRGSRLAIAGGRPRGTLYGVYSFLEDQLGCRWFTPEVSRIPRRERPALHPLEVCYRPPLEARSTDYPNSRDADWAVRNKINGTQTHIDARRGGKVAYGPFVHTFDAILNPARHFAEHPEWFAEVDGRRRRDRTQLCLTHPEVLRLTIETVRRWLREQPDATIFSVSQNDWGNWCTCPGCAKVIAEEGSPSGPLLRFVNAVADAVRDEHPDKLIDTLAYQYTRQPPLRSVPRPNVVVRLCSIECCFSHPLAALPGLDPANAAFARDLEAWGRICRRLHVWDYVIDYAHSIMPFPNLYSLRPNIDFFIRNGVKGIYEEANYFSRGGELAELRTWIVAKSLWDPSYDTDRAIDEFLAGFYGDAALPLRRYIDLVHGKARMDGVHFRIYDGPGSPLFSPDLLAQAEARLQEAEKAVDGIPDLLHRVRVATLPVLYVRIAKLLDELRGGANPEKRGHLAALLERFHATATREGVTMVSEGRPYDAWVAAVRKATDVAEGR